ncbi:hypothetical protein [Streptomyces guryensis]|uniref:Haloacid dehalogenase-like hydrolase n=1 Tax=Streptomyces guryensis TaxID=2886947 RepID=A0A9Q3ZAP5_9ACTN|nr:hypothetical protein [Streptomyces guryensis]MCD9879524.1 hypothetical protein [Streptomyces guryensis]
MGSGRGRSPGGEGKAFAIGNSVSDAEILHRTAHPIASEPDAQLARPADSEGWTIATRHDLLDTVDRTPLTAAARRQPEDPVRGGSDPDRRTG